MMAQAAVLVYGVLSIVSALILSSQVGSPIATLLAFVSAGLTYLFQVLQLSRFEGPEATLLWAGSVAALLASVFVSLWSAI